MKILISLLMFISLSFAQFIGLNPEQLEQKIKEGSVVVVDIRTPPEWIQTGLVPTSKTLMFFDENGNYDVDGWLNEFSKYVQDQNQAFVLVCRSGNRTNMVGEFLSQKVGFKNVYHLQNGINSWIGEKKKTEKYSK